MLRLCVIGCPAAHSLSPALHTAFLRRAGLDGSYTACTVSPDALRDFVAAAKAGAYDGFNVTMPHKRTIVPLLQRLSPEAAAIGAVNTVLLRDGIATGYNTDGPGFVRLLLPDERRVLLLGNGGAARALAYSLRQSGNSVCVCARRPRDGELPWSALCEQAARCDVLVNATPLGMSGCAPWPSLHFLEALPAHARVIDLIYEPAQTTLLARAAALGHATLNGEALLRSQAALAFSLFTDGIDTNHR